MNLFVSGMRRSGTTIVYDALLEDPGLHVFYEPFREDSASEGGGSGAHAGDVFAETRALREAYRRANYPQLEPEEFNWGGPRDPSLEVGPELPDHCRGFLRSLLDRPGDVAVKFTRMSAKVAVLHEADPDAMLVHVVRDPRSVAVSMMRGRGEKRLEKYPTADSFFEERETRPLWSSRGISRALRRLPEYRHVRRPANFLRVLMAWKYSFETCRADGRELYGERYVLLRNEDLRVDPAAALEPAYRAMGREVPSEVSAWAADHVKRPEEPLFADDTRWTDAFELLGMREALNNAGYTDLAAATPERKAPSRLSTVLAHARRQRLRA